MRSFSPKSDRASAEVGLELGDSQLDHRTTPTRSRDRVGADNWRHPFRGASLGGVAQVIKITVTDPRGGLSPASTDAPPRW